MDSCGKCDGSIDFKRKYEDLLAEYQDYAYIVSHDMQAPIRQLHLLGKYMAEEVGKGNQEEASKIEVMADEVAEKAYATIDALLVFSRLNTDQKNISNVNLDELAQKVSNDLGKIYASKKIINIEQVAIGDVYGDKDLLKRLFYYLLDNAFKFQPASDQHCINILIGVEEREGKRIYFIQDNGIGIGIGVSPDKFGHVFGFLRTNHDGSYPGRGCGLSFAKKIVNIHNGDIWFEPIEIGGTKICFTLGLSN